LRGCSGSGKSFVGFKLFEEYGPGEPVFSTEYFNRKKPKRIAEILPGGLCLAGRYVMQKSTLKRPGPAKSGGVDGFYPVIELQRMLEDLAARYPHMLFESLMISGTFQRWADFAAAHGGPEGFAFATLDTPLETCLARIQQRNGGKPVKEDQVKTHRKQVHRCASRLAHEAGQRSLIIDHRHSYEQVRDLFLQGGWDPGVESQHDEVQAGVTG
jgi:hypothetical protein